VHGEEKQKNVFSFYRGDGNTTRKTGTDGKTFGNLNSHLAGVAETASHHLDQNQAGGAL